MDNIIIIYAHRGVNVIFDFVDAGRGGDGQNQKNRTLCRYLFTVGIYTRMGVV